MASERGSTNLDSESDTFVCKDGSEDFSLQEYIRVASFVLGEDSVITPEEALKDEGFKENVRKFLQQEKIRLQIKECAVKARALDVANNFIVNLIDSGEVETTKIQNNESPKERKEAVERYQRSRYGIISPDFVFESIDMASSWRRYLINSVTRVRFLLDYAKKNEESNVKLLEDLVVQIQTHIDATDVVILEFFKNKLEYRAGQDLRKEAERRVFMDEQKYHVYWDLIRLTDKLVNEFEERLGLPNDGRAGFYQNKR
jgi:hypothetical protein